MKSIYQGHEIIVEQFAGSRRCASLSCFPAKANTSSRMKRT